MPAITTSSSVLHLLEELLERVSQVAGVRVCALLVLGRQDMRQRGLIHLMHQLPNLIGSHRNGAERGGGNRVLFWPIRDVTRRMKTRRSGLLPWIIAFKAVKAEIGRAHV